MRRSREDRVKTDMRMKVSDYIAQFFLEKGIDQVFCVCGGGAMHMNDSFGHNAGFNVIYNHHEQASAIAAEGYARIVNKPAIVCVTSGPGAINALNGVVGAYQDSIPMIVLSGQAKTSLTMRKYGIRLRSLGNQEFDIISALDGAAKYSAMIMEKENIRYYLERAYKEAVSGRMGPAWLDIPLDIQGSYIETEELTGCDEVVSMPGIMDEETLMDEAADVVRRLKTASRPVLYAGNGIRLSGGAALLHQVAHRLGIPVVTCWDSIDLIATDDECYCGRAGNMGDRPGNFAVQNSDLLICIGTRLNIYQVGFELDLWARNAYVVVDDIDRDELDKPILRADKKICADASAFMRALLMSAEAESERGNTVTGNASWLAQCASWKKTYPVVQARQKEQEGLANVYAFMDCVSRSLPENSVTVVANGSASVVGSAAYYIKQGDRFVMNCALSSMGYDLPAAIGACVAAGYRDTVCIAGDGSIQMNLQELQTIVTNNLPVKLFVINNGGYHQVRLTQNNVFHNGLVGVGPESGDLGFPDFEKLSYAYGIPYICAKSNAELSAKIRETLDSDGYCLCEIFVDTKQIFEPKSATKKLPDGSLVSPPLEDLAPFLPREELAANMYVPMVEKVR